MFSIGKGNVWVVYREIISDGTFKSYKEFLSGDIWFGVINKQKAGNATKNEIEILVNGHFKVK